MNRCNLMLHCGAHAVPRKELLRVQTPAATDTWQPIPHETTALLIGHCRQTHRPRCSCCHRRTSTMIRSHCCTRSYFGSLRDRHKPGS